VTTASGPTFGVFGALAAFPRRIAARAVEGSGGRLQRGVTRQTTHLVIGRRLLAAPERSVASRLDAQRAAGRRLLSENAFLRWLGLLEAPGRGELTTQTLIDRSRLAARDLDLLAAFDAFEHDAPPWSFRDLILAKKYAGLIAAGANWAAIARSVHHAGPVVSLTAKALQVGTGPAIYIRDGDALSELDGQLLLDLPDDDVDAEAMFFAAEAAEAAEETGRPAEAADLYRRCLDLDPGDAIAAFNRANCLRVLGRLEEAELDYCRALQRDPGLVEAWFNLAGVLTERGRTDAARRQLRQALARDPDYADAIFNLARLEFEAGDLDEASRQWRRYLELDAGSDWARLAERGLQLIALQGAQGRAG
jgi:tetratricopeptide (TPR) repeat protein